MNRHVLSKLIGEWEDLIANSTLVTNLTNTFSEVFNSYDAHLAGSCFSMLTCQVVFQVVLLNKLLLTVATLVMTDGIMSQEVLLQAPFLCESLFTDRAGKRL